MDGVDVREKKSAGGQGGAVPSNEWIGASVENVAGEPGALPVFEAFRLGYGTMSWWATGVDEGHTHPLGCDVQDLCRLEARFVLRCHSSPSNC
jgi:hypothetical protein